MSANVFDLVCLNRYRQAKLVLEAGGDPNFRNERDETPLMACSMYLREADRRSHLMRMLIRYGADVNAQNDKGQTVLMYTCILNQIDSMLLLLEQGDIDLDRRDTTGNTCLMYACALGRGPAVYVFLEVYRRKQRPLNLYCTNHTGQTARQIAEERNFVHIQDLFAEALDNDYWSSYMELSRDMAPCSSYPLKIEDPRQIPGLEESNRTGNCLPSDVTDPGHPLASMVEHVLQVSNANMPESTDVTQAAGLSNGFGHVYNNSLDNGESNKWDGVVRQASCKNGSLKTENSFDSSLDDESGNQRHELPRKGSIRSKRRKAKQVNADLNSKIDTGEVNGLIREDSFGKSSDLSSNGMQESEDGGTTTSVARRGSVRRKSNNNTQSDLKEKHPDSAGQNGTIDAGRCGSKSNQSKSRNEIGDKEVGPMKEYSFDKEGVTMSLSNGQNDKMHPSGIPKAPARTEQGSSKSSRQSKVNLYARHSFQDDDVEDTESSHLEARPPQTHKRGNSRHRRRQTTELNVTVADGKIVSTSPRRKRDSAHIRNGKSRITKNEQQQKVFDGINHDDLYKYHIEDSNNNNVDERVESGYSNRSKKRPGEDGVKLTARSKQKANMCSGEHRPPTGTPAYTTYVTDADIDRCYGYPMVDQGGCYPDDSTRDYITSARSRDMILNRTMHGEVGPSRYLYESMNVRGSRQSQDFGYGIAYDTMARPIRMSGDSVVVAGSRYTSQHNPYGLNCGEYDSVPTHMYSARESSPRRHSKANAW